MIGSSIDTSSTPRARPRVFISPPELLGTGEIATTLTVAPRLAPGVAPEAARYQWLRDGAELAGATNPQLDVVPAYDLAELSCRVGVEVRGHVRSAVTGAVTARYATPEAPATLGEEVFDAGSGTQILQTAADFTGEALSFSTEGQGATIDAATGELSIPTDIPVEAAEIRVSASNSGGTATGTLLVTVEVVPEPDQVVDFAGGDTGLLNRTGVPGLTTLDGVRLWLQAWFYHDGSSWSNDVIFSLADPNSRISYLRLQGEEVYFRDTGYSQVRNANLEAPAVGWHLVTGVFTGSGGNNMAVAFYRDGEGPFTDFDSTTEPDDVANCTNIALGYVADSSPASFFRRPAAGFAIGYGDPAAAHDFAWNGGSFREITDYDFSTDPNGATLAHYVPGYRLEDGTAFDAADPAFDDTVGSLGSFAATGSPAWTSATGGPPFSSSGVQAAIDSISAGSPTAEATITATLAQGATWTSDPTVDETRLDIWSEQGFGPINITSHSVSTSGGTATITLTLDRDAFASEPLKIEALSGWLVSPQCVTPDQTLDITNDSPLADPATADGISEGRIAIRFNQAVAVHRYMRDRYGVVNPASNDLAIVEEYPAPAQVEGKDLHGSQVNPVRVNTGPIGYDGRFGYSGNDYYDSSINASLTLPTALALNDSYVKARCNIDDRAPEIGGHGTHVVHVNQYFGLVVVNAVPGADEVCPALVLGEGTATSARPTATIDTSITLPSYSLTKSDGNPMDAPGIDRMLDHAERLNIGMIQLSHNQAFRRMSVTGFTRLDGYGLAVARITNTCGLVMIGDEPLAKRKRMQRALVDLGHQLYTAIFERGSRITPDGGTSQGQLLPAVLAQGFTTGGDVSSIDKDSYGGNELGQSFAFTSQEVTNITTPHDGTDADKPIVSKRKTIQTGQISGDWINLDHLGRPDNGESHQFKYHKLTLNNETQGTSSLITGQDTEVNGTDVLRLKVQDITQFAEGDVVYAVPSFPVQAGDYDWRGQDNKPEITSPTPETYYRHLNRWTGAMVTIKALGFMHSVNFDTFEGYVARANDPDNPTGFDYPEHHATYRPNEALYGSMSFHLDRDFYTEHWPTIAQVSSTVG